MQNRIDEFVRALNEYQGNDIWEDLIRRHPAYDDNATFEADPFGQSDIIVLTDGTRIGHFAAERVWQVC